MAYHVQGTAANVAKVTQALALLCGAKKRCVHHCWSYVSLWLNGSDGYRSMHIKPWRSAVKLSMIT
ncbi:hypothetical protein D3C76_430390 [compost metagenome]|jgi:hypothetical protein